MCDDAIATTAMLGLSGFRVLAVSEYDGELEQAVETTAEEGWCPACGVSARLHDRRPTWVRDLPAAGRPVTLVWVKRIWRCHEPLCSRVTWTEANDEVRPRASMTERARREACRRIGPGRAHRRGRGRRLRGRVGHDHGGGCCLRSAAG